jgi:hypothetical protein
MYAKVHDVSDQEVQLRVKLEGTMAERFLALKARLGFESNTDLVRLLITRAYEQEIGKPGVT